MELRVRTLLTDRLTAEIVSSFESEGVEAILMKGPVIAGWLYPDAPDLRPYGDADLLVAPEQHARAAAILTASGFQSELAGIGHPRIGPQNWIRARHEAIDLHTTLWGIEGDDSAVWSAFRAGALRQVVGGREVMVPALVQRAVQLALHAAQHADAARPIEDLERGVKALSLEQWRAAAELAAELDARDAFAAGLRQAPSGRSLADQLALAQPGPSAARLRLASVPLAEGFAEVAAAPGLTGKLAIVRREVLPSAEFMGWWSPLARRGRLGLALSYPWRLVWLARRAPAGVRAWWRAGHRHVDG